MVHGRDTVGVDRAPGAGILNHPACSSRRITRVERRPADRAPAMAGDATVLPRARGFQRAGAGARWAQL